MSLDDSLFAKYTCITLRFIFASVTFWKTTTHMSFMVVIFILHVFYDLNWKIFVLSTTSNETKLSAFKFRATGRQRRDMPGLILKKRWRTKCVATKNQDSKAKAFFISYLWRNTFISEAWGIPTKLRKRGPQMMPCAFFGRNVSINLFRDVGKVLKKGILVAIKVEESRGGKRPQM